jgi:hypothetical protein
MRFKIPDNLINKIKRWLFDHPWLKLISLILAIITWLYVQGEIQMLSWQ